MSGQLQKSLFDLPPELLDLILGHIHSDCRRARKAWVKKASTICKAFYHWVFPVLWDYLIVSYDIMSDCKPEYLPEADRKGYWDFVDQRLWSKIATSLKVLVIDGFQLRVDTYPNCLELLNGSVNLVALALGDQTTRTRFVGHGKPPKRSLSAKLPWQYDPRSASTFGGKASTTVFPKLTRAVLMDNSRGVTYENYAKLFIDSATAETVFPALTSVCLMVCHEASAIDLNDKFVDAMVTFCANHKNLRYLELHFEHNHASILSTPEGVHDLPCNHRAARHISMLIKLVARAKVSVTLHHQTYCEEEDMYPCCCSFNCFHKIGDNVLRLSERDYASVEELWECKTTKMRVWCQDRAVKHQASCDKPDHAVVCSHGYMIGDPDDSDDYDGSDEYQAVKMSKEEHRTCL